MHANSKKSAIYAWRILLLWMKKRDGLIENMIGYSILAHHGKLNHLILGDQRHDISVHIEACAGGRNVIGNNHIKILFDELPLCMGDNVVIEFCW